MKESSLRDQDSLVSVSISSKQSPSQILSKAFLPGGSVEISGSRCSKAICSTSIIPARTCSLQKWYYTSPCLEVEWNTWFWDIFIEDILSQQMEVGPSSTIPDSSWGIEAILLPSFLYIVSAQYSASAPAHAIITVDCLLELHVEGLNPRRHPYPPVERLPLYSPAQSESVKPSTVFSSPNL